MRAGDSRAAAPEVEIGRGDAGVEPELAIHHAQRSATGKRRAGIDSEHVAPYVECGYPRAGGRLLEKIDEQRAALWKSRKRAFGALGRATVAGHTAEEVV